MDKVLEYAKAIVAAAVAAAVAALAGVDWLAVVAAALVSGGGTAATPNKPKRRTRKEVKREVNARVRK
jgi:hypothetical protein